MSEACEIDGQSMLSQSEAPEEIIAAMQKQDWWLKFFVRPCCPPPGASGAKAKTKRLREEVDASEKFTPEQKETLRQIIDEREQWYLNTPFCKKS